MAFLIKKTALFKSKTPDNNFVLLNLDYHNQTNNLVELKFTPDNNILWLASFEIPQIFFGLNRRVFKSLQRRELSVIVIILDT